MRKNSTLERVLFVFLFMMMFLFIACQHDDAPINLEEVVQQKTLQRISLETLDTNLSQHPQYRNLTSLFDINYDSNIQESESSTNAWLLTDKIVMIEKATAT